MPEMPVYICHKEVRALKIARVEDRGTDTTSDENEIVEVFFEDIAFPPRKFNLRSKPKPDAGWYLIRYEDGYESFSPAKAFEEGYTLKG